MKRLMNEKVEQFLKSQLGTDLGKLLYGAYRAELDECKNCGRKHNRFAICCPEHFSFMTCKTMFVLQEPPKNQKDNCVCCFCHHDQTAFNLRYFIEHHRIDHTEVYITNAALHGSNDKENNHCFRILKKQIELIKPSHIVIY